MNMQVPDAHRDAGGSYKVDASRGSRVGRVSSEWFSRPDDERFLSLNDLANKVRGRSERSRTRVVETALIHVEANRSDPKRLALILPGTDAPVTLGRSGDLRGSLCGPVRDAVFCRPKRSQFLSASARLGGCWT